VREDVRNGYVSPQAAAEIYRQPQDEAERPDNDRA
jgi:hypothetical protein